jgi:hypothetical protein
MTGTRYKIYSNEDKTCHITMKIQDDIMILIYSGDNFLKALDAIHKDAGIDVAWIREGK